MKRTWILATVILLCSGFVTLPSFAKATRIPIQNRGSDSMASAVAAWSEAYQRVDPEVGIAVSGGGSGTGIAAMINGLVDIANASRPLTKKEIMRARKAGRMPVEHVVGYDAVAVYLHPNNPIQSLSFQQLGEIFGRGSSVENWTDLGVVVPGCKDQKIVVVSRQNSSGTYAYFRTVAVGKKYRNKFKSNMLSMQGSKDLVELVESTPCAIGYSSYAYATAQVKVTCISRNTPNNDRPCVKPSVASIIDKSYPMSRSLYMYTDGQPEGRVKEYIDWVLSDEGQCILSQRQYAPVRELQCQN